MPQLAPHARIGGSVRFLDCNVRIGRHAGTRNLGGRDVTVHDLERELSRHDVDRAVVHHVLAKEYHPSVGNHETLRSVADRPRLLPAWVLLPPHTGELAPPRELIRSMLDHGIRYTIMFPGSSLDGHRFSLADWCVGELLDELETRRVPLALDFTLFRRDEPPWDGIFDVCDNHPDLPVILIDIQGRNNRTLYALLRRFPHLHVQTAGFDVHRGLEHLAGRFGAERLVYGSSYPTKSMGGARLQLLRSALTETDKQLVAAENLERLLGGVLVREPVSDGS